MLRYAAICSLDGYTADEDGRFEWAAPSPEVHAFVNDQERPIGTYLYGRRMYETMRVWETLDDPAPEMRDYAQIWRAADKVVYSRTLPDVSTTRTRLEPLEAEIRRLDAELADLRRQVDAGRADLVAQHNELVGRRGGLAEEYNRLVADANGLIDALNWARW